MKILQINSAKAFGGGERHLIDLCQGLQNRKHEVFVAVRPNNQWAEKINFLPTRNLVHFPLRNSLDIYSGRQIAKFVQENDIEIVHAHVARDYPIAALASRLSKTPLVLTRHLTYQLSKIHRLTFKQAKRIIAVSDGVAKSLPSDSSKIVVINNGVDVAKFEKIEKNDRFGKIVVATIGELREHKGQEDFIRAAAIIAQKHLNVKFLIIGQDNSPSQKYRLFLEKLVEELNLKESVIFTGWLDDFSEIYGTIDIFVSAARSEPFGLVIAEAMASGKAIVATKTVGAKELLIDNECSKLVEIRNIEQLGRAVSELLENTEERQTLSKNARQRARKYFSLDKMVSETEKIYQSII